MESNPNKKDRTWHLPPPAKNKLSPALYLIATPIGNLGDITVRALDTLQDLDLLLCEDTRVTGKLLKVYDIKVKKQAYNDHAKEQDRQAVIEAIKNGQAVGLCSDAGTPLISDPGYKLVQACYEEGIPITALPGANAPLTALQLSALPSDRFTFIGFLPNKQKARQSVLNEFADVKSTLIAFESGSRLQASLADIAVAMPGREVAVTRELTKLYEEVKTGSIENVLDHYQDTPKGEIVLVISPPAQKNYNDKQLEDMLNDLLKEHSTKQAANLLSEKTGLPKKALYNMALKLKSV